MLTVREIFRDRGILRRVHARPRVFLFVPEQRMLPSGVKLDDFARKRRTVLPLPNGEQREIHDNRDETQIRIQGLQCAQWLGIHRHLSWTERGNLHAHTTSSIKEIGDRFGEGGN